MGEVAQRNDRKRDEEKQREKLNKLSGKEKE